MLKKSKFCNFRPFVCFSLVIIIAIVVAIYHVDEVADRWIAFGVATGVAILFFVAYLFKKTKIFIFFTFLFLIFAIPFMSINLKVISISDNTEFDDSEVLVVGRMSESYSITTNGYVSIVLDSVEISNGESSRFLDDKINLYTSKEYLDTTNLKTGNYVSAWLQLSRNTIESKDEFDLMYLSDNIVASGFVTSSKIVVYENSDKTLADNIKLKVYDFLDSSNMQYSDISYAMMFGETNLIDKTVKTVYQNTGIAHILAVSGLHVSIIVTALCFIFKKLKFSNKSQFIVLAVLLFVYSYLCNFYISVIRASLMAIILNYSYIRGKAYDELSVVAMLACFILIINPLQIFNASFVLSFLSVLSIILAKRPLDRFFENFFYDKLASELGLLFSLEVGITVVQIFYFKSFQPLTFLSNLVSIPIVTIAFLGIIIITILSIILPFLSFLCIGVGKIFSVVTQFNSYVLTISPIIHTMSISAIFIPIVFGLMFIISDYCFLSQKYKYVAASFIVLGFVSLFLIWLLDKN